MARNSRITKYAQDIRLQDLNWNCQDSCVNHIFVGEKYLKLLAMESWSLKGRVFFLLSKTFTAPGWHFVSQIISSVVY